jgi:hypothetical protein
MINADLLPRAPRQKPAGLNRKGSRHPRFYSQHPESRIPAIFLKTKHIIFSTRNTLTFSANSALATLIFALFSPSAESATIRAQDFLCPNP